MAYVALYRKYRSQSFGELMGQEAVTTTLQNAIRSGLIAHAYLFYGARGCGKTSTARLLARALNCEAHDGPNPEPCGVCRLCVSIRDGHCMDVVEMDAASETGIDDVREKIIENVQYAPGEARYKVYIIDEVHDLSAKAFDALLKTLEEP
ncbi:MAG: polymerase subunit gamma and tau, partial [Chthonomonadales bacterium]|nr:polymerase subunit gamma and tau [Chthonomonadales bacterium]